MGDELAGAGLRDVNGKVHEGFNGIGVFANAGAAQGYARERIKAVTDAAGLNSYFLDVDAAGTTPADYTPGREISEQEHARVISQRLDYPSRTLGLVTGSEGGVSTFAPNIAYSHGIATQPFDWTDPDMSRNEASPFFVGQYWPPETPTLFFQTVPLKPQLALLVRSYRYRLPLYQRVLHDSLVSTHHWAYPSLKFSNEQQNTALLQLLYMTPPMYHLNAAVLKRDMPFIGAYNAVFAPLHQRLFTQALVGFEVLADDRSLQRTVFEDGTRITANFNPDKPLTEGAMTFPPVSATVQIPGMAAYVIDMADLFKTTRPLEH
ncbi:glycoside hydrolase [Pseudomonas sp. NKUCC02_KPG]|nr:glycoside hydrolase [Pseudomonas sp. NKUCC02_KPG]